jgi:hypothetical protein
MTIPSSPQPRPPAVKVMRNLGLEPDPWQVEVLEAGHPGCCSTAAARTSLCRAPDPDAGRPMAPWCDSAPALTSQLAGVRAWCGAPLLVPRGGMTAPIATAGGAMIP